MEARTSKPEAAVKSAGGAPAQSVWAIALASMAALACACGSGQVHLSVINDGTTNTTVSVIDSSQKPVVEYGSLAPGTTTDAQHFVPGAYGVILTTSPASATTTVNLSYDMQAGNYQFRSGTKQFLRTDGNPTPSPVPSIAPVGGG